MGAQSRTTLQSYFETDDQPTQAQFVDLIDSFYSLVSDFRLLFGTISQSGTNAPVLSVLFNSLGFVPTFSYDSVGTYVMTSVGNLDATKTIVYIGPSQAMYYPGNVFPLSSPDSYEVHSIDNSQSDANTVFADAMFLMLQVS